MFYSFYREWPDIFHTVSGNSQILLSWSHYRVLLQVNDPEARTWYEQEAAAETWSVRTLQRNISTQYYYRLLSSRDKEPVITEMNQKTALLQEKASFIKNPYILEFLGLPEDPATTESKLENSIITNLQRFLMEFGKGFAFVARQQHIHTEKEDYYIDLVLIILNTFQLSYPAREQRTGRTGKPEEKRNTVAFPFCRARRFTETFVSKTALRLKFPYRN